jgi:hypothetical protein
MQRWHSLDVTHDIADLAGYNVPGTIQELGWTEGRNIDPLCWR